MFGFRSHNSNAVLPLAIAVVVLLAFALAFALARPNGRSARSTSLQIESRPAVRLAVCRHRPFRVGLRWRRRASADWCRTTPPAAWPPQEQVKRLFDGKTLDGWKIAQFGPQGEITVKDGGIILGFGDGCTGVTWKGDFPKVNYEVRLEAKRVGGTDFFCGVTFPVKDDPCSFIVGGWGGGVVGLSSIDGNDASNNHTSRFMEFEKGRWYRIRVRVTDPKIECWIDDEKVVDLQTAPYKFSIRPEVELSRPFGIVSWCTTAALRKIELRKVSGPDTPVDPDKL